MLDCLIALSLSVTPSVAGPVASPGTVTGDFVEARTASVFAGACHYNGELVTDGREAILAFQLDGGESRGMSLAGARAVVVLAGERNLGRFAGQRRCEIHLDADAPANQRAAVLAWLLDEHEELLGTISSVEVSRLDVVIGEEAYRVSVEEILAIEGLRLPDRSCCSMPMNVCYAPFLALDKPVVGVNEVFEYRGDGLNRRFAISGENTSFVGRLAAAR